MKVLGLTCGRPMGNSEIMVKEALMAAEELGHQVEMIRLLNLNIKPCTGCELCAISQIAGGNNECVLKNDDFRFLVEKMIECDGAIVGAPAYTLMPPGFLTMVHNRMRGIGKRFHESANKKPKFQGMIAVGGTDYIDLILPIMKLFLPGDFKLVDQMLVDYTPRPAQVLMNEKAMARARQLGYNVGQALKMPNNEAKYVGNQEETCPLCHQNLLSIHGKTVKCPLCDMTGTLEITEDRINVVFPDEAFQTSRSSPRGAKRHLNEIAEGHRKYEENKTLIRQRMDKYRKYEIIITPPSKEK